MSWKHSKGFTGPAAEPSDPVTRPVQARTVREGKLDDGRTVDAKVSAWTRTHVLLHWTDGDGKSWNVWVEAERVVRIAAEASAWRDPYDLEWQNRELQKVNAHFPPT